MKAVTAGDMKAAHRMAHSLKGNAGQIGKTELASLAGMVEGMLKDGNVPPDDIISRLETELKIVLMELNPLLDEEDQLNEKERYETVPLTKEQAYELYKTLKPFLENRKTDSLEFICDLKRIHGAEELVKQIDDFDFGAALLTLKKLMGEEE